MRAAVCDEEQNELGRASLIGLLKQPVCDRHPAALVQQPVARLGSGRFPDWPWVMSGELHRRSASVCGSTWLAPTSMLIPGSKTLRGVIFCPVTFTTMLLVRRRTTITIDKDPVQAP